MRTITMRSLLKFIDAPLPAAETVPIGGSRPLPARKALVVWVALMSAAWVILGAGAYAFLMPGS
jgi:hypothetical protein